MRGRFYVFSGVRGSGVGFFDYLGGGCDFLLKCGLNDCDFLLKVVKLYGKLLEVCRGSGFLYFVDKSCYARSNGGAGIFA